MEFERASGVLLHLNSLPGQYGIGDLGPSAYQFLDWLQEAGQRWWQVLPLGPTDDFNSPYNARSSWAGNQLYVSLEKLAEVGDLEASEIRSSARQDAAKIKYASLKKKRRALLEKAASRFFSDGGGDDPAFKRFCKEEGYWLRDWSLYAALREHFNGKPWYRWPKPIRSFSKDAQQQYRKELRNSINVERYIQFRFFEQWDALYRAAHERDIQILGDVPIYCAPDSADVWSAQHLFKLLPNGRPEKVAGVPPDYFSENGQLWGAPTYRWARHRKERFSWWLRRMQGLLRLVDAARIDHFIGFCRYWEVAGTAKTAKNGRWLKGPGNDLLKAVHRKFPEMPFIAEDLGVMSSEVEELRDNWDLPGMRVTQFAFGGDAGNTHLPFHHVPHCVAYTGTHDNNTTVGWYKGAQEEERDYFHTITNSRPSKRVHTEMIRLVMASCAKLAVVPMQDVLGLDERARVNTPGEPEGNYLWKLQPSQLRKKEAHMLRKFVEVYGRR